MSREVNDLVSGILILCLKVVSKMVRKDGTASFT